MHFIRNHSILQEKERKYNVQQQVSGFALFSHKLKINAGKNLKLRLGSTMQN